MRVTINESVGRFYINRSDKQYQASILVTEDDGTRWGASAIWPEDEAKDFSGMPPSEVAIEIQGRVKSHFFDSDRPDTLAKLQQIIDRAEEFDAAWATGEIKRHQQTQARTYQMIDALRRAYL